MKVVIDDNSNRSHLDNSTRPLNPEDENSLNVSAIKYSNKKKAPVSIHQNFGKCAPIAEVVSDKFTIGPNDGEIICPVDVELSISSKPLQVLGMLMIEDDPRLLLCTCAIKAGQINAFCHCSKIPNTFGNSQVYQDLNVEQEDIYKYF